VKPALRRGPSRNRRDGDRHHIAGDEDRLAFNPSTAPGHPANQEQAMSNVIYIRQFMTARAAIGAAFAADEAPREELDSEERRWQLEWARRNVED
jgi:hypothetical protein